MIRWFKRDCPSVQVRNQHITEMLNGIEINEQQFWNLFHALADLKLAAGKEAVNFKLCGFDISRGKHD